MNITRNCSQLFYSLKNDFLEKNMTTVGALSPERESRL